MEAARLVARLDGSAEARGRLAVFLETLAGRRTRGEAALALGISERRFHALRGRLLQAALEALEPRSPGRRAQPGEQTVGQVADLQGQVRDLRLDLRASQIREEIALAMPHLLQRTGRTKKAARRKARRKPAPASSGAFADCGPSASRAGRRTGERKDNERPAPWSAPSGPMPSPSSAGSPGSG
jgi:hypothetical protein